MKRNLTQIHKHGLKIKSGNLNFVILDRYICQAAVETSIDSICRDLLNLDRYYLLRVVENLSNFNEQPLFTCFLI